MRERRLEWITAIGLFVVVGLIAIATAPRRTGERELNASDLPPAAMASLRVLAGGETISKYAELKDRGASYYEGFLEPVNEGRRIVVTPEGQMVRTSKIVHDSDVPKAVWESARMETGNIGLATVEKQTVVINRVNYKSGDRWRHTVFAPNGLETECGANDP